MPLGLVKSQAFNCVIWHPVPCPYKICACHISYNSSANKLLSGEKQLVKENSFIPTNSNIVGSFKSKHNIWLSDFQYEQIAILSFSSPENRIFFSGIEYIITFFQIGFHNVIEAGVEPMSLLPQLLECQGIIMHYHTRRSMKKIIINFQGFP